MIINASQAINRSKLKSAIGTRHKEDLEVMRDKNYRICKFEDYEMKQMLSKSF